MGRLIVIVVCVGIAATVAVQALGLQRPWGALVVGAVAGAVTVALVSRVKSKRP